VATVTVTVRAATDLGFSVVAAKRRFDEVVELDIAGLPGRTYRVEASDDFATWVSLGSFKAGDNGLLRHVDLTAVGVPVRFYRLAETD
jgi:hypothetical protein